MKVVQKYLYCLICTIVLGLAVVAGLQPTETPLPDFLVTCGTVTKEISIYEADDGNSYVFLPSYANLKQTTVVIPSSHTFSLGSIRLTDGMDCAGFELETPYALEINGQHTTTLLFYQSANVPTIYIDTATGTMERIHADKAHEETVSVTICNADGSLHFTSDGNTLNGRGNSTWKSGKKPYTLHLSAESDLLGMGTASNWILLANALDGSNLHNKLIYDFTGKAGYGWSPECEFVDLYLNGSYNGLYLLSEKVEIGPQRLDIDTANGDFLCSLDFSTRWDSLRNPFQTQLGRTVEIIEPKALSSNQFSEIQLQVDRFEQTLTAAQDITVSPNLNADSWIRRYLIDEIFFNIDADLSSSYFYSKNGVIYAGPIWDYDMTFGCMHINSNPCVFYANMPQKYSGYASPYYSMLYKNPAFYNRMVEIYRQDFLPLLEQMIETEIPRLSTLIAGASLMNHLRWKTDLDSLEPENPLLPAAADAITDYLTQRIDFLNRAWLDHVDYCTVQFDPYRWYTWKSVSIERGHTLKTPHIDFQNTTWVVASTGDIFDPDCPVTGDLLLVPQTSANEDPAAKPSLTKREVAVFMSIGAILSLLFIFLIVDFRHRSKERRVTNAQSGSKISP